MADLTFNYTGDVQELIIPDGVSALYIELYGAKGSTGGINGGSATGIYELKDTDPRTMYVYVGGYDTTYNGGGNSTRADSNGRYNRGGGATDIRTVKATNGTWYDTSHTSWKTDQSLLSRIAVAGGGGGRGSGYSGGGPGGGLTGGSGVSCTGGSQTGGGYKTQNSEGGASGDFGIGGAGNGAGGGGWYGGAAAVYNYGYAGGGGSSYIALLKNGVTTLGGNSQTNHGRAYVTFMYSYPTDTSAYIKSNELDTTNESGINSINVSDTSDENSLFAYYGIKVNDDFYSYDTVTQEWVNYSSYLQILTHKMTKTTLNSLNFDNFKQIFKPGTLSLYGAISTTDALATPEISKISFNFPLAYADKGSILSYGSNIINSSSWKYINGVTITQTCPEGTNITYQFSNNTKTFYIYSKTVRDWIEDTTNKGMTKDEVESLTFNEWDTFLTNTFMVQALFSTLDQRYTPILESIIVDKTDFTDVSYNSIINIPVPNAGYVNTLTDEINITYTLSLCEGIAFDDSEVDYNFYVTPDKINLRAYDLKTLIGGRDLDINAVEIINSYTTQDYEITLYAITTDGTLADIYPKYGLLHDGNTIESRTMFSFSETNDPYEAIYPCTFKLKANTRKIIYFKVLPTIYTTIGNKHIQIKLIGRKI